ncbi:group II truncated hemoglobin [Kutzneria sp. 744]|uniref:group II truncated hemoglobin n=1 Tax=Kutzneria sp. (strain 744) TaxID=345341 RepID=UPI0012FBC207|nr:group II truncated hemoglobin [Kutzneria sp. 744]
MGNPEQDGPPTLYDWAGGEKALTELTEAFYREVLKDDLLEPMFRGMSSDHPRRVAHWLGEVFGGPTTYTAERGGYSTMLGMHLGKAITEPQRRRWISLLQDAADEVGLPADPEFRAAFTGYLEWGTRIALANSQPGAEPVKHAPVPHWGWGVHRLHALNRADHAYVTRRVIRLPNRVIMTGRRVFHVMLFRFALGLARFR